MLIPNIRIIGDMSMPAPPNPIGGINLLIGVKILPNIWSNVVLIVPSG